MIGSASFTEEPGGMLNAQGLAGVADRTPIVGIMHRNLSRCLSAVAYHWCSLSVLLLQGCLTCKDASYDMRGSAICMATVGAHRVR